MLDNLTLDTSSNIRAKSRSKDNKKAIRKATLRYALLALSIGTFLQILQVQHNLKRSTAYNESDHPLQKTLRQFQKPHAGPYRSSEGLSAQVSSKGKGKRILTAYLEAPTTMQTEGRHGRLLLRNTTAMSLEKVEFSNIQQMCSHNNFSLPALPIDEYPTGDPFLPWLHDYFVSHDGQRVSFVAQNRRRCDTGPENREVMAYWEPQVSLFQPVPVVQQHDGKFRLANSFDEATHQATRFQCRFTHASTGQSITTLSEYNFDYEYVTWRKRQLPMLDTKGDSDSTRFWLSTLLFSCPIPTEWQAFMIHYGSDSEDTNDSFLPDIYLDLLPIRTPARSNVLLTVNHTGPVEYSKLDRLNLNETIGPDHTLPAIEDAGRWSNLAICPRPVRTGELAIEVSTGNKRILPAQSKHQFVACTWTAASYARRGDTTRISDSAARLKEWILFHLLVGVEHIYVYDNTDPQSNNTELKQVCQEFSDDKVTYHAWPCRVCNNNRPANSNPGERSSQYAAEASCRERYGPGTEWMTFLDVDEYLVPMKKDDKGSYKWQPILEDFSDKNISVLQFYSSRGRPRIDLMEEMEDQSSCIDPIDKKRNKFPNTDKCVGPKRGLTFLNVYNCDYIRPPKPSRFARARKQIFRPAYVWSHFVHYSTVTERFAETYDEFRQKHPGEQFQSIAKGSSWEKSLPEIFADEITTGALIHARSVMPHETRRRSAECYHQSKVSCMVGYECDDAVEYVDSQEKLNVFHNADGSYCNCWRNKVVDETLVPLLEESLRYHDAKIQPIL